MLSRPVIKKKSYHLFAYLKEAFCAWMYIFLLMLFEGLPVNWRSELFSFIKAKTNISCNPSEKARGVPSGQSFLNQTCNPSDWLSIYQSGLIPLHKNVMITVHYVLLTLDCKTLTLSRLPLAACRTPHCTICTNCHVCGIPLLDCTELNAGMIYMHVQLHSRSYGL